MQGKSASRREIPIPQPAQVDRAIRLSYAQMMLNAVFVASTGGMFLIGFAIQLGADNILLGLMSAIPQFFVVFQLLAAWLVEKEVSRKKLTVGFAFMTPLCWFLIAAIPLFEKVLDKPMKFTILIGTMCLVMLAGQFVVNARASWIGELIPAERRGRFFGYCAMFAGSVGAVFGVIEGRFLDAVLSHGLVAFTALFFFGSVFGLISASLNVPQPDCQLPGAGSHPPFMSLLRQTFRNRQFCMLALVHTVVALGGIAGPFSVAYCLRDVGLSFFQLGLLNSVAIVAVLLSAPFWGKMVDRFGCRPVLILGLSIMVPCSAIWLGIPPGAVQRALWMLPWGNFLTGFGSAGFGVAVSTMVYKTSSPQGRSVQFALYNIFVILIAAPMPVFGGWLISTLENARYPVDLRLTFYLWSFFMLAAAILAKWLHEPESVSTRALVFDYFPSRMVGWFGMNIPSIFGSIAYPGKFRMPMWKAEGERQGGKDENRQNF